MGSAFGGAEPEALIEQGAAHPDRDRRSHPPARPVPRVPLSDEQGTVQEILGTPPADAGTVPCRSECASSWHERVASGPSRRTPRSARRVAAARRSRFVLAVGTARRAGERPGSGPCSAASGRRAAADGARSACLGAAGAPRPAPTAPAQTARAGSSTSGRAPGCSPDPEADRAQARGARDAADRCVDPFSLRRRQRRQLPPTLPDSAASNAANDLRRWRRPMPTTPSARINSRRPATVAARASQQRRTVAGQDWSHAVIVVATQQTHITPPQISCGRSTQVSIKAAVVTGRYTQQLLAEPRADQRRRAIGMPGGPADDVLRLHTSNWRFFKTCRRRIPQPLP